MHDILKAAGMSRLFKSAALVCLFVGQNLSAMSLSELDASAGSYRNIKTLQVAERGEVLLAKAYNGYRLDSVTNVKSVSKSVMSAMVGMAIERDILQGVDQPIAPILKDQLPSNPDSRLNEITIGHLLSMQAGLERTSGRNYGRWVASSNWVKAVLDRPFDEPVGGNMLYSTGNTHLLSAILMRETGENPYRLANRWFQGSGVRIESWETDPQGIPMGGNQLGMTPASLLAFGELYRRGGVTESGKRIVSKQWIEQSWQPRTQSRFHRGRYGYGWFMQDFSGVQGYYGWGYGGQMIYVLPELEMTIAITSQENLPSGRTGYRDELHDLVAEFVAGR